MSVIDVIEGGVNAVKSIKEIPSWIQLVGEVGHNLNNEYYRKYFYYGNFRDLLKQKKVDKTFAAGVFWGGVSIILIVIDLVKLFNRTRFNFWWWFILVGAVVSFAKFILACQVLFDQVDIAHEAAYNAAKKEISTVRRNRELQRQRQSQAGSTASPRRQVQTQPSQRSGTSATPVRSGPSAHSGYRGGPHGPGPGPGGPHGAHGGYGGPHGPGAGPGPGGGRGPGGPHGAHGGHSGPGGPGGGSF